MAGDQNGHVPFLLEPLQGIPHFGDPLRVQAVDRLIQYQKIRFPYQGQADSQPLLHAKGEVLCLLLPGISQPHSFQDIFDIAFLMDPAEQTLGLKIFIGGHIFIEPRGFNETADPGTHMFQLSAAITEYFNFSFRGFGKAADHFQTGGFSRSVSSDESIDSALWYMKVYMIHCMMMAELFGQASCTK